MPAVKSLPAYYVLIVADHGHPVPDDRVPDIQPTLAQRVRARFAGLRLARLRMGPRPA